MDVNQYLGIFLEEAKEHLQTLNRCVLDLEHEPGDLHILDEIFRSAHTIKGMSATMGYTAIAELTHEMENVLDLLRKGTLKAHADIIDTLFQCVDRLEQLVEDVANGQPGSVDVTALSAKLASLAKGETQPQVEVKKPIMESAKTDSSKMSLNETEMDMVKSAIAQGLQVFELTIGLRQGTLLKSVRAYMAMKALDEMGDVIKTDPLVEDLEKDNFGQEFSVLLVTDHPADKVRDTILSIAEIETVVASPCGNQAVAESATVGSENASAIDAVNAPADEHTAEATKEAKAEPGAAKQKGRSLLRVDAEKLDSLLNLVGELVINKTRLQQIGLSNQLQELSEAIEQMDRVTTDLQGVVMKLRMVPVGQVFNRFPRMVRDLSHSLGKEINLVIQGEETELDRTVIDEIGDPLVHLLRNSIDHGIEKPADRTAAGKNPVGEVRLIARHEGNHVLLMVTDDGKGLKSEAIRQKALEKGLVTKAELDMMEPGDVMKLVFLPGFSTAETVTDVSGRGVGMDAVRTKIEALGGVLELDSTPGHGTRVKIRLPLTLAIIQALLIQVHDETYAIPLGSIDSTINITPADIRTIQQQEVILLRGQIIPLIRLGRCLGLMDAVDYEDGQEMYVVIVQAGDHRIGLLVDSLVGQQEIVIKSLGKVLTGIRQIAGATILGDGQVVLIIDVNALG
ncbi:MAG TPA: chemotaxis protein CheA [Negativicutes bacterium]|nr:chemotaxis protein CheA [Negativicutes bacterium]